MSSSRLPTVAAQLGCTALVVATTIEPRAAMCAAADTENNDARVDQHTRETLPLVTPGLYLDAPNDSALDRVVCGARRDQDGMPSTVAMRSGGHIGGRGIRIGYDALDVYLACRQSF